MNKFVKRSLLSLTAVAIPFVIIPSAMSCGSMYQLLKIKKQKV